MDDTLSYFDTTLLYLVNKEHDELTGDLEPDTYFIVQKNCKYCNKLSVSIHYFVYLSGHDLGICFLVCPDKSK